MQNLALKIKPQKVFFKTTCYLATFEDKTLILFLLEVAGCLLYLATNLLPF